MVISLDTGPLSLVTHPKADPNADACKKWLAGHLSRGTRVVVPEVVDFELRRELLRAGKSRSPARLEAFVFRRSRTGSSAPGAVRQGGLVE